ncbi:nucleoplasmin-like protein ANO39 isoform X1 [Dreissena polymorpha]|uniref:nucleoplasmin-like protein ANO39 isoform X1 n=1 Tax=Dreissena polymorpha TaxID=45954 RepID=UPI002265141C|nr:nucleoplasmin-like protein ANO39 isoform X1 [Dreissena polymorpha]
MLTDSQECFWGVELSKEHPTYTWNFNEEDDDDDYMVHTLFLKTAVLGASAVKGERNLIQIETKNFDKKDVKQALLSLTLGSSDMCSLDVSFGMDTPVTFRLVEGAGPIALGGQQLVEFPPDDDEMDSQDESTMESTMDEELTEDDSPKKSRKRKAAAGADKKKGKKGKLEGETSSADDSVEDEEEEEEDEEEEEEDEEEEEEEEMEQEDSKKKPKTALGKKRQFTPATGGTELTVTIKGKKRRVIKVKRRSKN